MTSRSDPELTLALGISEDGHVCVSTPEGGQMRFSPEQARSFAKKLVQQAELIESGRKIRVN